METLAGRTVVITGSASGIGRATAHAVAARGANVVVADLDESGAHATADELGDAGRGAIAVGTDVGADGAFEKLRDAALDAFGRVDVVMNNVGVLTRGLPDHIPLDEWQRVFNVNVLSVARSIRAFVPMFLAQGFGHIVNTASFAGLYTYSYDRLPYAASKAAVIQLTEGLALYLRPKGIGVTLLCPGPVRTNIAASMRTFGPDTTTRSPGAQFAVRDPAGVGEEVAEAILADRFLITTDDRVRTEVQRRAADWDGFIAEQIAALRDQP